MAGWDSATSDPDHEVRALLTCDWAEVCPGQPSITFRVLTPPRAQITGPFIQYTAAAGQFNQVINLFPNSCSSFSPVTLFDILSSFRLGVRMCANYRVLHLQRTKCPATNETIFHGQFQRAECTSERWLNYSNLWHRLEWMTDDPPAARDAHRLMAQQLPWAFEHYLVHWRSNNARHGVDDDELLGERIASARRGPPVHHRRVKGRYLPI